MGALLLPVMSVPEDATDVLGRRIGAGLLDLLALIVLLIIVGVLFGQGHASGGSASVHLRGASVAVWALLALAYYFITEALSGQTPGKHLMKVRVMRTDGRKPSPAAIVVRTVLRIVDVLPAFYLLGLVMVVCSGGRLQRIRAPVRRELSSRLNMRFEMRPDEGPWRGVQPRCRALVRVVPGQYALAAQFPNGSPATIPLGRLPRRKLLFRLGGRGSAE
jgi:uncharacterized RDD family membrane protein YckC